MFVIETTGVISIIYRNYKGCSMGTSSTFIIFSQKTGQVYVCLKAKRLEKNVYQFSLGFENLALFWKLLGQRMQSPITRFKLQLSFKHSHVLYQVDGKTEIDQNRDNFAI